MPLDAFWSTLQVRFSVDDWKTTPWRQIDVDMMDVELKRFAKDIRQLDKEMKAWDSYTALDGYVKNTMTSLRAVADLQNPAIRDRHWAQLMQATKVRFQMDEGTTLADLLSLNLHKFEDEVKNIVDKAVKEMGMCTVLCCTTVKAQLSTTIKFMYTAFIDSDGESTQRARNHVVCDGVRA